MCYPLLSTQLLWAGSTGSIAASVRALMAVPAMECAQTLLASARLDTKAWIAHSPLALLVSLPHGGMRVCLIPSRSDF